MAGQHILILNAGSSSIKFAVLDGALQEVLAGLAEGIGGSGRLKAGGECRELPLPDHRAALSAVLEALAQQRIAPGSLSAAGHRVVHGGERLTAPAWITPEVLAEIERCTPLAPLHNPHSLSAIATLAGLVPDLPQFASFDTAFHATNPEVAVRYGIPRTDETRGIRRYGFHGLSYASLVQSWPEVTGTTLPKRLLACHLGNGASLCAIREGRSAATTMGYSPLEGLTMGTRAGGIDANAVLHLAEANGITRTRALLNHESGLLGLSGSTPDMRRLLEEDAPESQFAVEHFCYWVLRHAGSMIAAMEGLDAVAFTGGIGENAAPVRARILRGLAWLGLRLDETANAAGAAKLHAAGSAVAAWIVPAAEERQIARCTLALLQGPE
ncbi:acetate/propionate family kinase [Roseobacteraceae bacterium NS-SX3]